MRAGMSSRRPATSALALRLWRGGAATIRRATPASLAIAERQVRDLQVRIDLRELQSAVGPVSERKRPLPRAAWRSCAGGATFDPVPRDPDGSRVRLRSADRPGLLHGRARSRRVLMPLLPEPFAYAVRVPRSGWSWAASSTSASTACPWARASSGPRSRCPGCDAPIRWYQNVPVLSWLLLRGRCASCSAPHLLALPAGRGALRRAAARRCGGSSGPAPAFADRRGLRPGDARPVLHRSRSPAAARHDHAERAGAGPRRSPGSIRSSNGQGWARVWVRAGAGRRSGPACSGASARCTAGCAASRRWGWATSR